MTLLQLVSEKAKSPTRISSTHSSITLRMLQHNVGSYTITWNSNTNNGSVTKISGTTSTIDNLTSNTAYTFIVQNLTGEEHPSDQVTFATGLLNSFTY